MLLSAFASRVFELSLLKTSSAPQIIEVDPVPLLTFR
jgi:hypothetical protein